MYISKAMVVFLDNKSAINLARNLILHGKRKHIEVRFYHLREQVNKDVMKVIHCPNEQLLPNLLTKAIKVYFLSLYSITIISKSVLSNNII